MSSISHSEVMVRLNDDIASLARHLLGEPNRAMSTAHQLRYGKKGSVAVEIAGEKTGSWYDHEAAQGGHAIGLICHEKRLSASDAYAWALDWLGLSPDKPQERQHQSKKQDGGEKPQSTSQKEEINPDEKKQPEDKAEKVKRIISGCAFIKGTPAATYLRNRGITKEIPEKLAGFRRNAAGKYGALVAPATDDKGEVLAVQQIYVTQDGQKAPVDPKKRTNKAVDGWAEKAAFRLPGKKPIILAEGVETALSIWQATGHETWACLGISNIGNAPLPDKATVIVARDGDLAGSKADNQIKKTVTKLTARGHSVSIAAPPEGKDFNDILMSGGDEAVRSLIEAANPSDQDMGGADRRDVFIGSDVEIANRVREDLIEQHGQIVHDEGQFWRYNKTHWETIPAHELRKCVHLYDGATFFTSSGEPSCVKLGKSRVDSVLNELAALTMEPDFFAESPTGINCVSGFIRFSEDGTSTIEAHNRDHRCRHTLPGRWSVGANPVPPKRSLLHRLHEGVFRGDDDAAQKIQLIAEISGAAALGHATKLKQPRAVILKGETAENGKSQVLDTMRGALPPSAISNVTAAKMGDERHVIGLVGKLLNASDELSSAQAVSSEIYKAVITGDYVTGRDVYKSRVEFRPVAQHVFATNVLPSFQGGMDRGVRRRLLVITFNRVIPVEERIEGIGRRIASEEADLLLAWVVDGASRVVRQRNFTIPPSSELALADWIYGADPVLAWLDECTAIKPIYDGFPHIRTNAAHRYFKEYAENAGFNKDKLPDINSFTQRVKATGVEHKRTSAGPLFIGLVLQNKASQ